MLKFDVIQQPIKKERNLPNTRVSVRSFKQYHKPTGNIDTSICKSKKNENQVVG